MSRVDVIVPCYKYGHYLHDCVQSVLTQTGVDVRVLILDDASPDNTPDVAAELTARDPRVAYRRHAVNLGHVATYNEGLAWAEGDYVVLLSADDLLTPGSLARAARIMEACPEVGFTYGRQFIIRPGQPFPAVPPVPEAPSWRIRSSSEFVKSVCAAGENPVPTPTAVVRTRLQSQVSGYRKELPHTCDMEMWLRLAAHAPVAVVEVEQAFYRWHAHNMTQQYLRGTGLPDIEQKTAALEVFFRDWGHVVPESEQMQRLAADRIRTWGESAFWTASRAFDQQDLATCHEALGVALKLCPSLRLTRAWSRLRYKRLLGPKLWSFLRPLADRLRGVSVQPSGGTVGGDRLTS